MEDGNYAAPVITTITPGGQPKKIWIIAGIIAVLLLVGVFTYGYIYLDFFKSPKTLYLQCENTYVQNMKNSIGKNFASYLEWSKPYLENTVHSHTEITANPEGFNVNGDPNASLISDLLKKSKIIVDSATDQKNQKIYSKIDLALENNPLLGMEIFADKTQLGLGFQPVYSKYVIADLKDRDIIKTRFGATLPKKIMNNQEILDILKFTAQETAIFTKYGKIYAESISNQQVEMQKGTFTENGANIPCRILKVNFSGEQMKELEKKLTQQMAADEELIDLLYNKRKAVFTLLDDSGYDLATMGLKNMEKSDLKQALADLNKNVGQDSMVNTGLSMNIYVDNKHNILERQFILGNSPQQVSISLACWQGEDKKTNGIFSYSKGGDSVNCSTIFSLLKENGQSKYNVLFKLAASGKEELKLSGEIACDMQSNDKEKSQTAESLLKIIFDKVTNINPGSTLTLNFKQQDEIGVPVNLPVVNTTNSVEIAKVSDTELMQMYMEIGSGFREFMQKNGSLFQKYQQY